jgi:CheY-like chemotaxis protein
MVGLSLQRDAAVAVLRVRDTGAGIVPEHLPLVFGAFWQSTHTVERDCGGLGLGLALVKSLVQLHDGSIEARSEGAGLGAEFVARLPLTSPPATTEVMEASAPTQALRILVIEDNADVAQMLGEVLRAVGHETAEAHNGSRGIELAREFAPDVILCDLGLPDAMSGFEVARALRADAATAGIALVAVSGYGGPSDRRQSEEAGFDAHLTKPVGIEALTDVLARLRPP